MVLFLGGTCNNSNWRKDIISLLEKKGLAYFNPVVPDWTLENQKKEDIIKSKDDTVELYVITKEMTGPYSIAEAVDASNKKPNKLIFLVMYDGFDLGMTKSLKAVEKIISNNKAFVVSSLQEAVNSFESISKGTNLMINSSEYFSKILKRVKARLAWDKNRLDKYDDNHSVLITSKGNRLSCEEAVLTWQSYPEDKRKSLSHLLDLDIIKKIYSTDFNYLKNTDDVQFE